MVPDVIRINQTTKTVFNTEKKMFGSLFEECRCVSVVHCTGPGQLKAAQRVIFNKVDTEQHPDHCSGDSAAKILFCYFGFSSHL